LKMSLVLYIKFISRYFIVFKAIVSGIASLISFSVCSLLVYRKAIDFCLLILYPASLQKEFMTCNSFLGTPQMPELMNGSRNCGIYTQWSFTQP
jgi:hypothetical protein